MFLRNICKFLTDYTFHISDESNFHSNENMLYIKGGVFLELGKYFSQNMYEVNPVTRAVTLCVSTHARICLPPVNIIIFCVGAPDTTAAMMPCPPVALICILREQGGELIFSAPNKPQLFDVMNFLFFSFRSLI
jgi:hypothetical protein